jgi:hypothetical protein
MTTKLPRWVGGFKDESRLRRSAMEKTPGRSEAVSLCHGKEKSDENPSHHDLIGFVGPWQSHFQPVILGRQARKPVPGVSTFYFGPIGF